MMCMFPIALLEDLHREATQACVADSAMTIEDSERSTLG
jgi:hypothetical protein